MTSGSAVTANSLLAIALREAQGDHIQEIPPGFYRSVSDYLGGLQRQQYDGIEADIKDRLNSLSSGLASALLQMRLEKASRGAERANLTDEEKFILDSGSTMDDRQELILGSVLHGKSGLLDSVSKAHKARPVVVRFLKDADQIIGADMAQYGPFKAQDVAAVPYDNAQAFISSKTAARVVWQDGQG